VSAPQTEIVFDADTLIEEASQAAQLSDFGADDFREPLEVLIRTYDEHLTEAKARKKNRRRVVGLLATRLRIEAALHRHPEIGERPVRAPMFLTGLPRSGTSALFNLLGADPAARPLLLWETQFPDPPTDLERGAPDPRRDAIEAYYEQSRKKNPEFTKIHFASADTPEECVLIHAYSLTGVHIGWEVVLEPYASWFLEQDFHAMYAYQRTLLQMLDWQRPGERWLLKSPAHMWGLDALLDIFPDASIVWSHRDPLACTASICSMTHTLMKEHMEIDKTVLGPLVLDFYVKSLERGLAIRDRSDPKKFVDVSHDDFVDDSMGVVDRIYGQFGIGLGGEARGAMEAHVAAHPKGAHGAHEYALDDWGLEAEAVREQFASYVERFGIDVG
jgi:hypothetical protein